MAKRNGGIIGPDNVPAGPLGAAKGVWRIEDAFNYQKAGLWPTVLGYQVPNSARFNSASNDFLSRTNGTPTNNKILTFSAWIKRSNITTYMDLFDQQSGSDYSQLQLTNGDAFVIFQRTSGSTDLHLQTTQLFRDVSAWYHIVVAFDTTQATASNRIKLYVNGTQVTSFSIETYPSQNLVIRQNTASLGITVGNYSSGSNQYAGYMSEVYMIDGQQLTPSSFGQTDSTTGIWIPKAYTGTYGTNGFYLKFANSAALGTDSSGNGNTFTVNNLTSVDQSTDSPTNNFATLNSLRYTGGFVTFTEGNLRATCASDASDLFHTAYSTIGVTKGKWYAEFKIISGGINNNMAIGAGSYEYTQDSANQNNIVSGITSYFPLNPSGVGEFYVNGVSSSGLTTATTNDIIGIALNADDGQISFYKNGTQISTTRTLTTTASNGITYFIATVRDVTTASAWSANFGSPEYSANSYTDANGFGNFSYAVPSGYYSLCSKNLSIYG